MIKRQTSFPQPKVTDSKVSIKDQGTVNYAKSESVATVQVKCAVVARHCAVRSSAAFTSNGCNTKCAETHCGASCFST